LEIAIPSKYAFRLDRAHRIGRDFAGECDGSVEIYLRIKRLLDAHSTGGAIGIRLNIRSNSAAIPADSNRILVLCSSMESLGITDWIEVIHANDFRFSPNHREAFGSLQREINGFHDCRMLECVELSRSVEVVGRVLSALRLRGRAGR
jgi:hypothetical protein